MYEYCKRPKRSIVGFYQYISCGSLKREAASLAKRTQSSLKERGVFQSLKREAASLARCAASVAWEAGKGKPFRVPPFCGTFSRLTLDYLEGVLRFQPLVEACERLRSGSASLRLSHS